MVLVGVSVAYIGQDMSTVTIEIRADVVEDKFDKWLEVGNICSLPYPLGIALSSYRDYYGTRHFVIDTMVNQ